jgi:hypothetical protein
LAASDDPASSKGVSSIYVVVTGITKELIVAVQPVGPASSVEEVAVVNAAVGSAPICVVRQVVGPALPIDDIVALYFAKTI